MDDSMKWAPQGNNRYWYDITMIQIVTPIDYDGDELKWWLDEVWDLSNVEAPRKIAMHNFRAKGCKEVDIQVFPNSTIEIKEDGEISWWDNTALIL